MRAGGLRRASSVLVSYLLTQFVQSWVFRCCTAVNRQKYRGIAAAAGENGGRLIKRAHYYGLISMA
jgi:hypothetical protein